jgi:2-polyprenyl-3-methyl-5-hydroxy-6-metoxy-1,4-benzoquinol methylase
LAKCKQCSFIFSYKIPEKAELDALYTDYASYETLSNITVLRYDKLLLNLEKYRFTNNMLDYGCGNGYFLERAKLKGWNIYGIEYDKEASKHCIGKGINIIDENCTDLFEKFDVVYISEVIEHVLYPKAVLHSIYKYLRKGGIIFITTPNFNSLSRRVMKNNYTSVLNYPEHLSYFTAETLKKIICCCNLDPSHIKTHGISTSLLKINFKKKPETILIRNADSKKIMDLTEKSTVLNYLKMFANYFLSLTRLGDTIKCYAKKN